MTDDGKQPYLQAADLDKKRYYKEVGEYKEAQKASEAEAKEAEKAQKKIEKNSKKDNIQTKPSLTNNTHSLTNGDTSSSSSSGPKLKTGDIPIFTDEFLEHNKVIDSELRLLRKSNTDYEQQNAVLEKHVENMQNGIDKLESEIVAIRENNTMLESYIDKLKRKLATAFASLSLPGKQNFKRFEIFFINIYEFYNLGYQDGANFDNIEGYMLELQTLTHPPSTINKAKDVIRKLDLQIQI